MLDCLIGLQRSLVNGLTPFIEEGGNETDNITF